MKYRQDFVTNSSSSSFIIINIDSPTIKRLFNQTKWDKIIQLITDYEFASAALINESVTSSIALSLLNTLYLIIDLKDKNQSSKLNNDLTCALNANNLQPTIDFIDKWLPIIKEEKNLDGITQIFEDIQRLIKHKEEIDRDSTGEIKGMNAQSDCGGPLLNYSHLNVVNGDGTYRSYNIAENNWDRKGPSEFERWAKEHGHYDGDYSEDLYWIEDSPIYDEIANTFEGVNIKKVKNGNGPVD